MQTTSSYIICSTPRCGSHLFSDGLVSTRIAGNPTERFPRLIENFRPSVEQLEQWMTEPPPDAYVPFDPETDAAYIRNILDTGTTPNGVFGVVIHWFQFSDALKRIRAYLGSTETDSETCSVLRKAFPRLKFIWLQRRDKVAQAVSWYRAIQTRNYIRMRGGVAVPQLDLDYNEEKIRLCQSAVIASENSWRGFFSAFGIKPHTLVYERWASDYAGTIRGALQYLGLYSPGMTIAPPQHEKASDARSADWIRRFRASQNGR